MWFRFILTAFVLGLVLYLQFGFDMKDWVKESTPSSAEVEPPAEAASTGR